MLIMDIMQSFFIQRLEPVMIVELDALCELDLDLSPVLVPDGHPPALRDVPLAASDYLNKHTRYSIAFVIFLNRSTTISTFVLI